MIYFFELIHPIIEPKIKDEQPKRVIPSPISLDASKKYLQYKQQSIQYQLNILDSVFSFFIYFLDINLVKQLV